MHPTRVIIAATAIFLSATTSHAEPIGVEQARKLPIIDTHFHVMDWMDLDDVPKYMSKHNVVMYGGISPQGRFANYIEKANALGDRYIMGTGTSHQVAMYKRGGVFSMDQ